MNQGIVLIELVLGMHVIYQGREYVLAGFRESRTHEGCSIDIQGLEPLYAERNRMDQEQRREAIEKNLQVMNKFTKDLEGENG